MARLGGRLSVLAGVIYVISGIFFFAFQAGRFDFNSIASISAYFQSAPEASWTWGIVNLSAALAAFLSVAGDLALSDRLRTAHDGLARWASTLAIIGYSIVAITNVADYYQIKRMAAGYSQVSTSAQSALEAIGIGSLDPTLSLHFITLGPWFLIAGWLALRQGLLPKPLGWLGVAGGIVALASVILSVLEIQSLTMLTVVVALLLHPIWLVGTGLVLWRDRR